MHVAALTCVVELIAYEGHVQAVDDLRGTGQMERVEAGMAPRAMDAHSRTQLQ